MSPHVYICHTDKIPLPDWEGLLPFVCDERRRQVERRTGGARVQAIAVWALLAAGLSAAPDAAGSIFHLLDAACLFDPALHPLMTRRLGRYGTGGKPFSGGIRMANGSTVFANLSHSGPWVAAAVSRCHVGVDIQHIGTLPDSARRQAIFRRLSLENNAFDPGTPIDFARWWSLRESAGKLTGKGITESITNIAADGGNRYTAVVSGRPARIYCHSLPNAVCAAAVWAAKPPEDKIPPLL